jgi:ribosomal protein L32
LPYYRDRKKKKRSTFSFQLSSWPWCNEKCNYKHYGLDNRSCKGRLFFWRKTAIKCGHVILMSSS